MYRKIFVFLMSFIFLISSANVHVRAEANKKKAIVIYDRKNYFSYSDNMVQSMKELFGAFNVEGEELSIGDYKSNSINKYDFVFVLGIDGNLNNEKLLKDLKNYKNNICWIGKGVEYFLKENPQYNLKYDGKKMDITNIYYSNNREKDPNISYESMEMFTIESKEMFTLLKLQNKDTRVFSYISDGKSIYPHALNNNNFWYISRLDDNSVLFYIFSDLLNDIFSFERHDKGKVYIRIEDVHPFRDEKKLRAIADYLYGEGVPFMVALIPTFVDTKTGYINTISHKKDFAETIRYMQNRGGSVILHGYTHQNTKEEASGEGFEFWNGQKDEPLKVNMEEYVYNKVGSGLRECVKNGIYPLGFEAPHYAMDSNGYKEIKKYFSTYVGQYQNNNKKFTTTPFPYIIEDTENFNKLVPENLGYVEEENLISIKNIKDNFREVSLVRGYTAGVFFHCYLDIKNLKEIVDFFKENEVKFLDLKNEENWTKWNDINIISKHGKVTVKYPKEKYKEVEVEQVKKTDYIENINLVLTVIIGAFCIVFTFIFIFSKGIDKRKFLR